QSLVAPVVPSEPRARVPGDEDGREGRVDGPTALSADGPAPAAPPTDAPRLVNELDDDRASLLPGDVVILIVENDVAFARYLLDQVRELGMKGVTTSLGVTALALAAEFKPSAITLDIHLPDIEGWRVLDRLKHDPQTRHVPVAVVSTDDARERSLAAGAYAFLAKPIVGEGPVRALLDRLKRFVLRSARTLLAVSADAARLDWFTTFLAADDVKVIAAASVAAARARIAEGMVDCIAWDGALDPPPDARMPGTEDGEESLPLVVYGERGREAWRWLGRPVVVHEARTPEALLVGTALLLHRSPSRMSEAHRALLRESDDRNEVLAGRRVMIVDDDMRNIFALSSLLEDRGMTILAHDNGSAAVAALEAGTEVDAILMDVMMPEMDGFDTIRAIRRNARCKAIPIIAVTAKAMKGDREKCMEAGAWDYLSKPVDPDLMVGVLRAWLSR
ncbi:MAG TPA: response regulator, partial [Casimicrobiaceae bacterium]